ncbi:MAG: hydroxyacid dehydrogenase, partial [Salinivirgaceae bacterium]
NKEECLQIIDQYDGIIIRSKFIIDDPFLEKATKLKFIGRVGAGMENIDVEAAEKRGIKCFNSPEGNRDAVGEQALGMLLALQNNLIRANSEVRNGIWRREENRGAEIKGKTIGIIGFGNMGSTFAKKLQGMEMQILAYDKYKKNYAPAYVKETSLEKLFKESDIISLHVPLTEETRFMVNDDFLKRFSKQIIVINTARGKVLQTEALVKAMKSGKVTGACLDVLEYEATSFENLFSEKLPEAFEYLKNSERVILSPHIAGWTHESNVKLSSILAEKIIEYMKGS